MYGTAGQVDVRKPNKEKKNSARLLFSVAYRSVSVLEFKPPATILVNFVFIIIVRRGSETVFASVV